MLFASCWFDLGLLRSFCYQYLLGSQWPIPWRSRNYPALRGTAGCFHLRLYNVATDLIFLSSTPLPLQGNSWERSNCSKGQRF